MSYFFSDFIYTTKIQVKNRMEIVSRCSILGLVNGNVSTAEILQHRMRYDDDDEQSAETTQKAAVVACFEEDKQEMSAVRVADSRIEILAR